MALGGPGAQNLILVLEKTPEAWAQAAGTSGACWAQFQPKRGSGGPSAQGGQQYRSWALLHWSQSQKLTETKTRLKGFLKTDDSTKTEFPLKQQNQTNMKHGDSLFFSWSLVLEKKKLVTVSFSLCLVDWSRALGPV